MKVIIDNNLPHSLARLLSQQRIDAAHVVDLGLSDASDEVIRKTLSDQELIFISRDHDFWVFHPRQWAVIWLALHNPTLVQLKGPIVHVLTQIIPTLRSGQRALVATDQIRIFEERE